MMSPDPFSAELVVGPLVPIIRIPIAWAGDALLYGFIEKSLVAIVVAIVIVAIVIVAIVIVAIVIIVIVVVVVFHYLLYNRHQ